MAIITLTVQKEKGNEKTTQLIFPSQGFCSNCMTKRRLQCWSFTWTNFLHLSWLRDVQPTSPHLNKCKLLYIKVGNFFFPYFAHSICGKRCEESEEIRLMIHETFCRIEGLEDTFFSSLLPFQIKWITLCWHKLLFH